MEALYERVLARVPTPQLHENYNAVLEEELQPVARTLDDVTSAFAKLEEVHDAVSKLQQSHDSSTGGRSDSIIASTDNAMELQRQLQHEVNKLAAGMKVAQVERKRKRVKEEDEATVPSVAIPVPNGGGEDNGRASCKGTSSNTKRIKAAVGSGSKGAVAASGSESSSSSEADSDDDDGGADDAEGTEAAWKALTTTKGNLSASSSNTSAAPKSDTISNSSNSINALSGLHDRATQVCKEVMLRRKKCISPTEAHALMETVQTLLNDQTPGWNPRGDVIIRKCVHELKNILVHAQSSCDIKSRGKFEACYAMIAKWKVEALPAEFQ